MSSFNQGVPTVPTLINSSNCIVLGNTSSGTALTVQQLGAGAVMNVATSTGSSALFVSSTGQVGVGTAGPNATLDVRGTSNILAQTNSGAALYVNGNPNQFGLDSLIKISTTGGPQNGTTPYANRSFLELQSNTTQGNYNFNMLSVTRDVGTAGEKMYSYINGSGSAYFGGNVGIGTASPSYQLTVTSNIYNQSSGGGFYAMNCGNLDGLIQGVYNGGSANPDGLSNSDMFIGVNYNQQTGQRLAGTNHGVAQIQLVGGNATVGAIKFRCLAAGTGAVSTIPVIQTITPTGVGIGTTNPSCPLDVRGTGSVALSAGYYFSSGTSTLNSFGAANYNLSIFASNQIGASAFNASSDRRIKENIHTLTNALETVNKLRPVTYNYIDKLEHGEKTSHGFIAQEVEEVVPDAVGQTTAVVPTIYRQANAFTETTITVTGHGLQTEKSLEVGDPETGKTTIDIVRVIDADNLEVKFEKVPKDKLFVVGPEVDDSRVLNHDHLMAVGFGGLKELHALVKTQQTTIEMLTERLALLESKLAA